MSIAINNHHKTADQVVMAKLSGLLSRQPSMTEGVIKNRFRNVPHIPRVLLEMVNMGFLGCSEKKHPKSHFIIKTYYLKRPFTH